MVVHEFPLGSTSTIRKYEVGPAGGIRFFTTEGAGSSALEVNRGDRFPALRTGDGVPGGEVDGGSGRAVERARAGRVAAGSGAETGRGAAGQPGGGGGVVCAGGAGCGGAGCGSGAWG
ncbi:hypothetical protein APASM_0488 [Actinosynnema pretiosum subsp. pretiosum]|nr:hypothetical protein APASM_0488 [Actinosynnema pretiosum subsp. pretiosum]